MSTLRPGICLMGTLARLVSHPPPLRGCDDGGHGRRAGHLRGLRGRRAGRRRTRRPRRPPGAVPPRRRSDPTRLGRRRPRWWPPRAGGRWPSTSAATATATGPPNGDYSFTAFCADCVAVADQLGRPPVLVGASLGGMSAMLAEGTSDRTVSCGLVLVDITPKTNDDGHPAHQRRSCSRESTGSTPWRRRPPPSPPTPRNGTGRSTRRAS